MPDPVDLSALRAIPDTWLLPHADMVEYRPVISCRACSSSDGNVCSRHRKGECSVCGAWITQAHSHLSYSSHASITAALAQIDPAWAWLPGWADPLSTGAFPEGLGPWALCDDPRHPTSLLARLVLLGHVRPGIGTVSRYSVENSTKELIGDFLRNAAMRFGIHLGLWTGAVEAPRPRMSYPSTAAQEPADPSPMSSPRDPSPRASGEPTEASDDAQARTALSRLLLSVPESARAAVLRSINTDFGGIGACPPDRLPALEAFIREQIR